MAKMMPKEFIENNIGKELAAINAARLVNDKKAEKKAEEKLALECAFYFTKISTEGKEIEDVLKELHKVEIAKAFFDTSSTEKQN